MSITTAYLLSTTDLCIFPSFPIIVTISVWHMFFTGLMMAFSSIQFLALSSSHIPKFHAWQTHLTLI